jgi:hypothetical protein
MRFDELLADFGRHRAARQQVLGAVDLGRLGQDGGAAVRHQQVDGRAQRRVGADAGSRPSRRTAGRCVMC